MKRYTYDGYGRVAKRLTLNELNVRDFEYTKEYEYRTYVGMTSKTYTDSLVSKYTSTLESTETEHAYTYDARNNITRIVYSTDGEIRYVYDDQGQLLREDNSLLNATYVYTYDNAGNILSKSTYALTAAGVTPTNATNTREYG